MIIRRAAPLQRSGTLAEGLVGALLDATAEPGEASNGRVLLAADGGGDKMDKLNCASMRIAFPDKQFSAEVAGLDQTNSKHRIAGDRQRGLQSCQISKRARSIYH